MCRCFSALAEEQAVPALEVSGWEVEQAERGQRNYTVLTLEMLAAEYPGAALYLAVGSDMLLSFDGWHRWQDILKLAHLVVTSRNIGDDPVLHEKAKRLDAAGARILFAPVEALPMASSDLRARLAAGDRCEKRTPAPCPPCHPARGLYREKSKETTTMNQKQAKELVRSRLSDKRYEHTLNVRRMAVKLAKRHDADENRAALAALLHDAAKRDLQGRDAGHHEGSPGVRRGRGRAPHPGVARHLRRHPRPHRVGGGG